MLVADVATKVLAESDVLLPVRLPLGIDLELSHNRGIAFGALTDLPPGVLYGGVSALVLILLVAVLRGWPQEFPAAGGLLLGGAVGNLGNRLLSGQVTDFVAVPHFAVFNLADVAITFGIVLLVVSGFRERPDGPDVKARELAGRHPSRLPRFRAQHRDVDAADDGAVVSRTHAVGSRPFGDPPMVDPSVPGGVRVRRFKDRTLRR